MLDLPNTIMIGYAFKGYAHRADADFVPSLIGTPVNGSAATAAYYEQIELPSRELLALAKTQYVVEGTDDPILQARHPNGKIFVIPKSELEEIAAANHEDDIFDMLNKLFRGRVY